MLNLVFCHHSFANLTQAKVTWEERTSNKKMTPRGWPMDKSVWVGIFLINNGYGQTNQTVGSAASKQMNQGYMRAG